MALFALLPRNEDADLKSRTQNSKRKTQNLLTGLGLGLAAGYGVRRWWARPLATADLVAHRGGAAEAPENTLPAFENACDCGITSWELDVQLTRDDRLVVFHDETLDRTTDGTGPLAGHTLGELRRLDAGAWRGEQWRGTRIPTLEEVIGLARTAPGGSARLLVEIKSPHLYPGIERRLIATLTAEHYAGHVLIMSFDRQSLTTMRDLAPRLPLVQLTAQEIWLPLAPAANAEIIAPAWQVLAANPLLIPLAHRAGRRVYTWTVNDPRALRWLRRWGIDGIISDRIDLLREA